LVASAIAATTAQRALTWTQTVSGPGGYEQVTVAGLVDGTSTVTLAGGGVPARLTWSLLGSTVYFEGDAAALVAVLGFAARSAGREAGKWISATNSAGPIFQQLTAGLTVGSAVQMLDLVGQLVLLPATTVQGAAVVGVECKRLPGPGTVTETLYVAASGTPLPVELSNEQTGAGTNTYFGRWGGPPAARAPLSALKFLKSWTTGG
jgi:hypothetical protein